MKNIEPIDLGNNETIHLKKTYFGYRIVHPIKNQDGTTNWINLLIGGWGNFWTLMFIMLVLLSFLYGVKQMMASCNNMAEHPEQYFDCSFTYPINTSLKLNYWEGETNVEAQTSTGS